MIYFLMVTGILVSVTYKTQAVPPGRLDIKSSSQWSDRHKQPSIIEKRRAPNNSELFGRIEVNRNISDGFNLQKRDRLSDRFMNSLENKELGEFGSGNSIRRKKNRIKDKKVINRKKFYSNNQSMGDSYNKLYLQQQTNPEIHNEMKKGGGDSSGYYESNRFFTSTVDSLNKCFHLTNEYQPIEQESLDKYNFSSLPNYMGGCYNYNNIKFVSDAPEITTVNLVFPLKGNPPPHYSCFHINKHKTKPDKDLSLKIFKLIRPWDVRLLQNKGEINKTVLPISHLGLEVIKSNIKFKGTFLNPPAYFDTANNSINIADPFINRFDKFEGKNKNRKFKMINRDIRQETFLRNNHVPTSGSDSNSLNSDESKLNNETRIERSDSSIDSLISYLLTTGKSPCPQLLQQTVTSSSENQTKRYDDVTKKDSLLSKDNNSNKFAPRKNGIKSFFANYTLRTKPSNKLNSRKNKVIYGYELHV